MVMISHNLPIPHVVQLPSNIKNRLVLANLRPQVTTSLDPLQFPLCPRLESRMPLSTCFSELDKTGSTVRIMFFFILVCLTQFSLYCCVSSSIKCR